MLKITIFFLLIFPSITKSQTCVVVFQSSTGFCIAADSRVQESNPDSVIKYDTMCKIHLFEKGTVFAFVGRYWPEYLNFAKQSIKEGNNIDEIANLFHEKVSPLLEIDMQLEKKNFPSSYKIKKNGYALEVIICRFEGSFSKLLCMREKIDEGQNGKIHIYDSLFRNSMITSDSSYKVIGFGHHSKADSILNLGADSVFSNGLVAGLDYLIKAEIKASPDSVGEPIDILYLKKDRYSWLRRQIKCDDN